MPIEGYDYPEEGKQNTPQNSQESNDSKGNATDEGSKPDDRQQTETNEGTNNPEKNETSNESPEQLAVQKFDEIINKINKNGRKEISFNTAENKRVSVGFEMEDENQKIYIKKEINGNEFSYYTLEKTDLNKFFLHVDTTDGNKMVNQELIQNLTPDELLNDILPKFEQRLKEAEDRNIKTRKENLQRASEYAQNQSQQEAERMMDDFLAV